MLKFGVFGYFFMPKNGDVIFKNAKFGKWFPRVRRNLATLAVCTVQCALCTVHPSTQDSNTDGRFGDGVYLTSMSPDEYTKKQILRNCFDGMRRGRASVGYYFEFQFPDGHSSVACVGGNRDIWIYKGDEISLLLILQLA